MSQGSASSSEAMVNLINNLPSDVIIDILSRLSVLKVIHCKKVCKSWLRIIETGEFVQAHLSRSVQGLIVYQSINGENLYSFLELIEEDQQYPNHDLHYKLISTFDLPFSGWLAGSADGLLLMCQPTPLDTMPDDLYICNPIIREYIRLDSPQDFAQENQVLTFGFGCTKMSNQYKVVRISYQRVFNKAAGGWQVISQAECHVYTLGTGSWRSPTSCGWLEYPDHIYGVFYNGRIHWVVKDPDQCIKISCFDLETESFSTMSVPPFLDDGRFTSCGGLTLFVSEGCLGLCNNTSPEIVVLWLMKDYGVENSWTRRFTMLKNVEGIGIDGSSYAIFYPIKIFNDGDILLAWKDLYLMYFSGTTMTIQEVDMFAVDSGNMLDAILHTPTLLSLESFGFENVTSF